MKFLRRLIIFVFLSALTAISLLVVCDRIVANAGEGRIYDDINSIPHNKVAVVLGTSPRRNAKESNKYFDYRIEAAAALFKAGKVDNIVVSGDNRHPSYNEPKEMRKALINAGVPANRIYVDNAGLRTLDSVVRMKTIFGQSRFTIVSQKFQNERAVCLAMSNDIDAIAFCAEDVSAEGGLKVRLREYPARVKMFIDLYLGTGPLYGGETIEIK